jgi:hypothetical protein
VEGRGREAVGPGEDTTTVIHSLLRPFQRAEGENGGMMGNSSSGRGKEAVWWQAISGRGRGGGGAVPTQDQHCSKVEDGREGQWFASLGHHLPEAC